MNVLLTCAGRRNYLVQYFREALAGRGLICATDASPDAPAMQEADRAFVTPRIETPGYSEYLLTLCRTNDIGMVLSLNDLELPILAAARPKFIETGIMAVVSSEDVIDISFDKWRTSRFLESCGLATCQTHLTLASAVKAIDSGLLSFPLIIKPRWGTASINICRVYSRKELQLAFNLTHHCLSQTFLADVSKSDQKQSVMIQECLTGPEYGLDIVNDLHGNTVAVFVKKKLAMRAGETDRAVTVKSPELEAVGMVIGKNLRHIGNLDCDVFLTPGGPRVLELNPRFGGGYPFSHEAGANVPAALLAWAEGREPDPAWLQYSPGISFAKCDRLVRRKL